MTTPSLDALQWIDTLVGIDTVSRNSNLGLIETVRDHLRRLGFECWLTFDRRATKANLFCSIPDRNGGSAGGVVLSGHTDVVPVEGQDWDTDPFAATVQHERIYGRGSADMKGFIGTVLGRVPVLAQMKLAAPVHIALSFDEEIGCLGAPLMIDALAQRGIRPVGCIVGEPTNMDVVVAHKGFSAYQCSLRGQAAHSSIPAAGVNAIEFAARLIDHVRGVADDMRVNGPLDGDFDVPYSTVQTSSVRGGGVINTVPEFCELEFVIRHLPQVEVDGIFERIRLHAHQRLLGEMLQATAEAGPAISFESTFRVPGLEANEDAPFTRLVRRLSGDHTVRKVAYGTEAGLFQRAGIPTIVCGPGDIRQAHRKNEYITLAQIRQCEVFLETLTQNLTFA
jgi:acetylornithine deacetylase